MAAKIALLPKTVVDARAMIEMMTPADRTQLSADWLARINAPTKDDELWTFGYTTVRDGDSTTVGHCGFKGPPDGEGMVEIAYGTVSAFEGQGYATAAARALVEIAWSRVGVSLVRAHTIAPDNASTRILGKVGFACVGDVIDPEDGQVWRWELRRGEV